MLQRRKNASFVQFLLCIHALILQLPPALVHGQPLPATTCKEGSTVCSLTNAYGRFPVRRSCKFMEVYAPSTEAEVLAHVDRAGRNKFKIKVVSKHVHTLPEWGCPGGDVGMLISTENLNRTIEVNEVQRTVTADSGVYLRDLLNECAQKNLALPTSPYWQGVSVGGVLGTGGLGSSLSPQRSALSDSVVGMRLVVPKLPAVPDGTYASVEVIDSRTPDLLAAASLHLGVLGVVTSVTFRLEPMFKRKATILKTSDDRLETRVVGMKERLASSGSFHVDIQWFPIKGHIIQRTDEVVALSQPGSSSYDPPHFRPTSDVQLALQRRTMEEWQGFQNVEAQCGYHVKAMLDFTEPTTYFTQATLTKDVMTAVGFQNEMQTGGTCDGAMGGPFSTKDDSTLDDATREAFGVPRFYTPVCPWDPRANSSTFELSIAVPLANVTQLVMAVRTLEESRPGATCVSLREGIFFRFAARSSALLGLPEDSVFIEMQAFRSLNDPSQPLLNQDIFEEIEQIALSLGGRPHWAKNRPVAFEGVADKYPGATRFLTIQNMLDPMGLFRNRWFDDVFDISTPPPAQVQTPSFLSVEEDEAVGDDGCAMEGRCVCRQNSHCSPERYMTCVPGLYLPTARVCRFTWPCNGTSMTEALKVRMGIANQWLMLVQSVQTATNHTQSALDFLEKYFEGNATWTMTGLTTARTLDGFLELALLGIPMYSGGSYKVLSRTLLNYTIRWSRDEGRRVQWLNFSSADLFIDLRSNTNVQKMVDTSLAFPECAINDGRIVQAVSTTIPEIRLSYLSSMPISVCKQIVLACPDNLFPYNSMKECEEELASKPISCNDNAAEGDTVACRAFHVTRARIAPFRYCKAMGSESDLCKNLDCLFNNYSATLTAKRAEEKMPRAEQRAVSVVMVLAYVAALLPAAVFGFCWLMAGIMERQVAGCFNAIHDPKKKRLRHIRLDGGNAGNQAVCTILFSHLNYHTKPRAVEGCVMAADGGRPRESVQILRNVWGKVEPGKLIAIMGPSGSGKTTLMKLLAKRPGVEGTLSGTLLHFDRQPSAKLAPAWLADNSGYVPQESTNVELHPHLTVRESLVYRAMLKLPKRMTVMQKVKRVEGVIREMGLSSVAETKLREISGGQKRRTLVAMHLLVFPALLFLDEPTSGLDSSTALELVKTLYVLSRAHRTVVMTIHQPRARILCLADRLAIMQTGGEMVYWGPPQLLFDAIADTNRPRTSIVSKARIILGNKVGDQVCKEIVSVYRALDTDRTGLITRDKVEWWIKALGMRADPCLPQDPALLAGEVLAAMGWTSGRMSVSFFQFVNFVRDTGALGAGIVLSATGSLRMSDMVQRADNLARPFRKKSAIQISLEEKAGRAFSITLVRGVREWMNRKAHRWVKRIYDFDEDDAVSYANPGDTIIDELKKQSNDLLLIPAISQMRLSVEREATEAQQQADAAIILEQPQDEETGDAPSTVSDTQSVTPSTREPASKYSVFESFTLSLFFGSAAASPWAKSRPRGAQGQPAWFLHFWEKMVVRVARFVRSKGVLQLHSMVISSFIAAILLFSIFGRLEPNSVWNVNKFCMLLMIFLITTANITFFQVTSVWVPEAKRQFEVEVADGVGSAVEISTLILLWDTWLMIMCAFTSCAFLFLTTNFVASVGRLFLSLVVFSLFTGSMQGIGTILSIVLGQTTATISYGSFIAVNLLFCGFVVPVDSQPIWYRNWLHISYVSPSYHTMNAIMQLRFKDQPMNCKSRDLPEFCYTGNSALASLSYDDIPLAASVGILTFLFITTRILVHVAIAKHGSRRNTTLKLVRRDKADDGMHSSFSSGVTSVVATHAHAESSRANRVYHSY